MNFDRSKPIICLVTKGEATDQNLDRTGREICDIARSAIAANVSLIQLREKNLSALSLFELSRDLAAITSGTATRLLINDRADVAVAAGADGVHLTGQSISADVIRKSFPLDLIIGVSTHTASEVADARRDGADFALFGPVFSTPGKGEPTGLDVLAQICQSVLDFPVIAIGGVDGSNYQDVTTAGAAGFASIRWLNDRDFSG